MNLHPKLERFLMTSCDQFFSAFPQKRPAKKLLEDCLIISHRGIHDQREIKENTRNIEDRSGNNLEIQGLVAYLQLSYLICLLHF